MSCMPLSFLKPDEQLVLEGPSSVTVVNGPTVAWYAPIVNSARKRKALQLEEQQYAKIKDTLTGRDRRRPDAPLHGRIRRPYGHG